MKWLHSYRPRTLQKFYQGVMLPQKQSMVTVLCDRPVLYEAVSQHPLQLLWLRLKSCSSPVTSHSRFLTLRSSSETVITAAQLCVRLWSLDTKDGHYHCAQTRTTHYNSSSWLCAFQNCTLSGGKKQKEITQNMSAHALSRQEEICCWP